MCGDIECTTPVEAIFPDATCRLHMDIPPIRSYNQARVSIVIKFQKVQVCMLLYLQKDSESDYDESLEPLSTTMQSQQNTTATVQKNDFEWQSNPSINNNPSDVLLESDQIFVKSESNAYGVDFGGRSEDDSVPPPNICSDSEIKMESSALTDDLKNDEIAEQLREMEDDVGDVKSLDDAPRYEKSGFQENEDESELQVS